MVAMVTVGDQIVPDTYRNGNAHFAEITALLEDAHGLAVEGQGHNLTLCEVRWK